VSSANKRRDTRSSTLLLDPTEKPYKNPLSTVVDPILFKASMKTTNSKGDKKIFCLDPRKLLKKPSGDPLIKRSPLSLSLSFSMVSLPCWWSVESKEFALSVVGGFTGIRIYEKRKGVTRSILIDMRLHGCLSFFMIWLRFMTVECSGTNPFRAFLEFLRSNAPMGMVSF
jgi:hypothetical protein